MTESILQCDFETKSKVNIGAEGAYRYATDPSTEIYMLGWAFDDEPVTVWVATEEPFPQRIIQHVKAGGAITAFNATFERLIWWYVLSVDYPEVPEPKLEQFFCTAARARAHGLPSSLKDTAACMGIPQQKQESGTRLIRQYCAQNVVWADIPLEDKLLMVEYCRGDVEAERGVGNSLRQLTDYEWSEYHYNERMNDRGIPVDVEMAKCAIEYAEDCLTDIDNKVIKLTDNAMWNCRQRTARDKWLLPQLDEEQLQLITKSNGNITFDSDHRAALAAHPKLPMKVFDFVNLMEEAGGSTIAKYKSVANSELDGVVNGLIWFNGAGQTGRFSSKGLQVHNMKRDVFEPKEAEKLITTLKQKAAFPDVTNTLARLIRAVIHTPEGMSWCDWSAIEGRAAPWLADSPLGEAKLDLYRNGLDTYKVNAAEIFKTTYEDVDSHQRQAGKVAELALGFLGGKGALQVMAKNYGIVYDDDQAQKIVDAWRKANPYAKRYGFQLESASARAFFRPGKWFSAGRVSYAYNGEDWLWCKLPSGRLIAYFKPRFELVETPWDTEVEQLTCVWGSVKPKAGKPWTRRSLHGGILLENVTQGTCGCILRDSVMRAGKAGLDVLFHVHDEIIIKGNQVDKLAEIMLDLPEWADGLPMAVSKEQGTRYGK